VNVIAELEAFLAHHEFVWLGRFTLNCYGLARHLSFHLLILRDYGLDDAWAASRMGVDIISLERETGVRIHSVGIDARPLFEGDFGAQVFSALLQSGRQRNVATPYAMQELEALAAASDGRVRIISPLTAVSDPLNNKLALRRALPELGIEPVPHVICRLIEVDLQQIRQRYGLPFVVQLAMGAGGSGTFYVSSERDLTALQADKGDQEVSVSKYITGMAPNINAVVLDDGVLLSYPSIQVVGTPECVGWAGGYCGNDFTATRRLPESAVRAIYDQTLRIGAWIGDQGFRGMWGIDFVVDGSRVYPLEVNPRFQGSTRLLTELQYLGGEVPLALAHVAGFLDGGQALLGRLRAHWGEPQPLDGAQIDLHTLESDWSTVRGSLQPGVYGWDGARGVYCREGMTIADCQTEDEFVLSGTVPRTGTRVEPGSVLLRIQTRREILDGQSDRLKPWASQVCGWVYRALELA
jgi:formate-dependent phosphoribosylglycinamide formyltransferase (GAR transformylase)